MLVEATIDSMVAKADAPGAKASDASAANSADVSTAAKSTHMATAETADVASAAAAARFCGGRKQARSKHDRYKHCYQSSHDENSSFSGQIVRYSAILIGETRNNRTSDEQKMATTRGHSD
jgi:hypothetical protein